MEPNASNASNEKQVERSDVHATTSCRLYALKKGTASNARNLYAFRKSNAINARSASNASSASKCKQKQANATKCNQVQAMQAMQNSCHETPSMQRRRVLYNLSKKVPLPMQEIFMPFEKAMQSMHAMQAVQANASKNKKMQANASKCNQMQAMQAMQTMQSMQANANNASNANYAINASKQTIKQLLECGLGGGEKTTLVYARIERFLTCNF